MWGTGRVNCVMVTLRTKVLVVDDLALNRHILSAMLRKLGFEVLQAENGLQCLDIFRREHLNLSAIFLDLQMPVLDGWETAKHLRRLEALHCYIRTPVIACTAAGLTEILDGQQVEQRALGCGVDECINKPLGLDLLQGLVSKYQGRLSTHTSSTESLGPSDPSRESCWSESSHCTANHVEGINGLLDDACASPMGSV